VLTGLSVQLYSGYDLDEKLPRHNTISRTRKLVGKEVFLSLFQEVLRLCIEKGMVSGKCQAVDSAFISPDILNLNLLQIKTIVS
jgi:hypothetical protein